MEKPKRVRDTGLVAGSTRFRSSPEVWAKVRDIIEREKKSNVYLKNAIYNVKVTELIETIKAETNELLDNLPQKDKSELQALQEHLVLYVAHFMVQKDKFVNENVLNSLRKFLTQKHINLPQLKEKNLHRIIICIALRVFAQQGSHEAQRLEHLIKRMPLIK
jgi:hypothetical protein